MNTPSKNTRDLKALADMASPYCANVPHAHEAGKQAMKMQACLEMVLMFHDGSKWADAETARWIQLQRDAGSEWPLNECTTRVLCKTIREVLGQHSETP